MAEIVFTDYLTLGFQKGNLGGVFVRAKATEILIEEAQMASCSEVGSVFLVWVSHKVSFWMELRICRVVVAA